MNYRFLTQILHLNFKENVEKMMHMVTFIAHLNVSIKHLTRYKQKVVLAAMLEGKSMPSNMAAYTNHATLLKNQSATKYLPQMHFLTYFLTPLKFHVQDNFYVFC